MQKTSATFKLVYCLFLLSAILPFGLAKSGWVALATGGAGMSTIPLIGPVALLILGLYRIYLVAKVPGLLDAPAVAGPPQFLRAAGAVLIYVGVVAAVLSWIAAPLMRSLITQRTGTGVEFFVVGVYLSLGTGIGMLGLFCFEFGRLLSFERQVR